VLKWNGTTYVLQQAWIDIGDFIYIDYDGDGSKEFVTTKGIYKWNGTAYVQTEQYYPAGGNSVYIGDTDTNGSPNIVISNSNTDVAIFNKTTAGDWLQWPLSGSDGATTRIDIADHDADGNTDIVYLNDLNLGQQNAMWNYVGSDYIYRVYTGSIMGAGIRQPPNETTFNVLASTSTIYPNATPALDTNGDGSPELVKSAPIIPTNPIQYNLFQVESPISHGNFLWNGNGLENVQSWYSDLYNLGNINGIPGDEFMRYSGYRYQADDRIYTWDGSAYVQYGSLTWPLGTDYTIGEHTGQST
jgi:hypothetical protein